MKHLDLFSGIGGFALAARWAGYETVQFVENEPYCQRVLAKHWPDVPIHGDIHTFDGKQFTGTIDLLTGGFPCQPFSVAGKKKGSGDDRYLWPEMARVIAEVKPRWVVAENVSGIVEMALDTVLADLESQGYETGTLVVPACATDAPHRRDRVWIVAHNDGTRASQRGTARRGNEDLRRPNGEAAPSHGIRAQRVNGPRKNGGDGFVADADDSSRPRFGQHCGSVLSEQGSIRLSGSSAPVVNTTSGRLPESEHESRFAGERGSDATERTCATGSSWWTVEPNVGRVAHGVSRRVDRLRALGNAIVPQVAYEIIRAITEIEA